MHVRLEKEQVALLVVDVQDKIFSAVDHSTDVLKALLILVKGLQALDVPIFVSEQYPQGLGSTVEPIRVALGLNYQPWIKSTFSCLEDLIIAQKIKDLKYDQWIVVGVEAHVCVLQTAKQLQELGKQVITLNDAISSRSVYDFATAIAEMRDADIRVSSVETILFELLKDSKAPAFKTISQLIKSRHSCCGGCTV
jgi:nicotinamidase-related amidase